MRSRLILPTLVVGALLLVAGPSIQACCWLRVPRWHFRCLSPAPCPRLCYDGNRFGQRSVSACADTRVYQSSVDCVPRENYQAKASENLLAPGRTLPAVNNTIAPDTPVAVLPRANWPEDPSTFAASIAWGDGQKSDGRLFLDSGGGFAVLGGHDYGAATAAGSKPVTVTITRQNGQIVRVVDSIASLLPARAAAPPATTGSQPADPAVKPAKAPDAKPPADPEVDPPGGRKAEKAKEGAALSRSVDAEIAAIRRSFEEPASGTSQTAHLVTPRTVDDEIAAIRRSFDEPVAIARTRPALPLSKQTVDAEIAAIRRTFDEPTSAVADTKPLPADALRVLVSRADTD